MHSLLQASGWIPQGKSSELQNQNSYSGAWREHERLWHGWHSQNFQQLFHGQRSSSSFSQNLVMFPWPHLPEWHHFSPHHSGTKTLMLTKSYGFHLSNFHHFSFISISTALEFQDCLTSSLNYTSNSVSIHINHSQLCVFDLSSCQYIFHTATL